MEFEGLEALPRLAWCVRLRRRGAVRVLHGADVETGDGWFCEGAWSGEFAEAGFESASLMGSGGKLGERGLLLASPSHTMERLYVLRCGDEILASNSCAFLLAQAGDGPDPGYLFYSADLASVIHGIDRYVRTVPTRSGRRIRMYCYCNLLIGPDLRLFECRKPAVRAFADFADYKRFLDATVTAIAANATDPRRKVRYAPVVTISTGYDSPATAVLARAVGCAEAVTFRRSRAKADGDRDDCGAGIGAILGLRVAVYDRLDYLTQTGFPEAEGGISEFLSLAPALDRRLLFTGFNGTIWERCRKPDVVLRRTVDSGNNLGELRLRKGFVHVAVPYLGCASYPSIYRISNSEEMRPWMLGCRYDKPIPRRIAEEAGVPREMFGMEKKAAAVAAHLEGFDRVMTGESFQDFARFVEARQTVGLALRIWADHARRELALLWNRMTAVAPKRLAKLLALPVTPAFIPRPGSWGAYTLLFHWSMEKLLPRYAVRAAQAEATPAGLRLGTRLLGAVHARVAMAGKH